MFLSLNLNDEVGKLLYPPFVPVNNSLKFPLLLMYPLRRAFAHHGQNSLAHNKVAQLMNVLKFFLINAACCLSIKIQSLFYQYFEKWGNYNS